MSKPTVTRPRGAVAVDAAGILADLRELIHSARRRVATVANAEQTLLYWRWASVSVPKFLGVTGLPMVGRLSYQCHDN